MKENNSRETLFFKSYSYLNVLFLFFWLSRNGGKWGKNCRICNYWFTITSQTVLHCFLFLSLHTFMGIKFLFLGETYTNNFITLSSEFRKGWTPNSDSSCHCSTISFYHNGDPHTWLFFSNQKREKRKIMVRNQVFEPFFLLTCHLGIVRCLASMFSAQTFEFCHLCVVQNEPQPADSFRFDLGTIRLAMYKFSDTNKIDEGGYGDVYKVTN